ncbi:MAG: LCP family protein [Candidatus Dormibacteraeota bacterium]|nr:LCP family protein [Candidatus Dormibacteraeota bacterium]
MRLTVLTIAALTLSAIAGGVAYFFPVLNAGVAQTGQQIEVPNAPGVKTTATPALAAGAPFTVLLLGSDDDSKFSADHVLTQSMILVRVNPASKQVTMLSIPRDLWVPLSTGGRGKIDGAYSYGRASAAIATVQRNFGVHIDDYAWIGLKGLIRLIDQLGGVDVYVSNPVLDDFYPNDIDVTYIYGYTRVAVLPGAQHLDGSHALQWVRSRHDDANGDFGRSQRQQQVLVAIRAKAATLNAANLPDIVNAMAGEFKTSMSLERIRALLGVANGFDPANIKQIVLLPPTFTYYGFVGAQSVMFPNWAQINPLVRANFP